MTTAELPPSSIPRFSDWITLHASGRTDDEMTAALAAVTDQVASQGKAGSVTLKVTIEPAGSGRRTVMTSCTVDAKPPKLGAEKALFYVGDNGGLHQRDPYQTTIDVGEVRRLEPTEPPLPGTTPTEEPNP